MHFKEGLQKKIYVIISVALFIIIFIVPGSVLAKRDHPEKWYQQK